MKFMSVWCVKPGKKAEAIAKWWRTATRARS